jgi:toxin ParE1/3/4
MRVRYAPSTVPDLQWFRRYYERVFPEGAQAARRRVKAMETLLAENPFAGRRTRRPGVRRIPIRNTPFLILYRVQADAIEILRVIDTRSGDLLLDD